jgi:hypothetical protein
MPVHVFRGFVQTVLSVTVVPDAVCSKSREQEESEQSINKEAEKKWLLPWLSTLLALLAIKTHTSGGDTFVSVNLWQTDCREGCHDDIL